jgi:YggT family protein
MARRPLREEFMLILIDLLGYLLWVASVVIIVQVVVSLLVAFNVVNRFNPLVRGIHDGLDRLTGPLYRPIRRILPDFGGMDFSPLVVILVIGFLQRLLVDIRFDLLVGAFR